MVKRSWTEEERKAFGEKMAEARASKRQRAVKLSQNQRPGNMEPTITAQAAEQGITLPANQDVPKQPIAQIIPQLPDSALYNDLEHLTLEEFVKKHTDAMDANIDAMARVTRLSRAEIFEIQRELGYPLPEGV